MAAINLSATMDAIASTAISQGVTTRAYGYPVQNPTPPCLVVGWPTKLDFDMTFKRGSDEATFPIWFFVSDVLDKAARDKLSAIITGATGIKDKLDGNLGGAVQTARVVDCSIEQVQIAAVTYLAAKFEIEVIT